MTNTAHYNLRRPDPANDVDEEFYALQLTLDQIDDIIFALKQVVDGKALSLHEHEMSQVIGLVAALEGKMSADKTFTLDDLTDVDGAAMAAVGYVLVKAANGTWVPSSPAAAIGNHQHSMADIVGLASALTALSDAIAEKAAASTVYTKSQVDAAIAAAVSAVRNPVGQIITIYGNGTTTPVGYLKVVPGLEVTAAYPQLRAFGLSDGWAVNGSGNPVMPTVEAFFLRGWRAGQGGNDAGRAFGSVQQDALQGHWHGDGMGTSMAANSQAGALFPITPAGTAAITTKTAVSNADKQTYSTDGSNGAPRVANETRGINITVTYYIKAYDQISDPATVNAAAVVADLADARARLAAAEARLNGKSVSPEQSYVNNSAVAWAHGLGVMPAWARVRLVCKDTEGGYAVGEKIYITTFWGYASNVDRGVSISGTATQIIVSVSPTFTLNTRAGTSDFTPTPAKWRMEIEAFKE